MGIDTSLESALRAWGHAQVNRYVVRHTQGERTERHPLQQAASIAPGTRARALARLRGRDGHSRREYMARDLEDRRIVPMWACDPVTSSDDACRPHDPPEIAHDMGIPDDLRWVEAAIGRLARVSCVTAEVLRIEYTMPSRMSQGIKSRMVKENTGEPMYPKKYREELRSAVNAVAVFRGG